MTHNIFLGSIIHYQLNAFILYMIQIINADFQRFQSILQKLSVCFDVRKQN